jgi:hypothetical protein
MRAGGVQRLEDAIRKSLCISGRHQQGLSLVGSYAIKALEIYAHKQQGCMIKSNAITNQVLSVKPAAKTIINQWV